jgi:hypothetical protein
MFSSASSVVVWTPSQFRGRCLRSICLLVLMLAAASVLIQTEPALGQHDVLTQHNDFARSGVQSKEWVLNPSTVNTATFGKLFSLPVDSQVYAQPLYVSSYKMADGNLHNIVLVATEHDSVYAFDADGKQPKAGYYWKVTLLGKDETTATYQDVNTTDIDGEIGVTGTPVIDRTAGVLYVVAKSKLVSGQSTTYLQRIHALDLATGKEMLHGPTLIEATVPGTGDNTDGTMVHFNPLTQNQRAGLALSSGSVWIAWASHGDNTPYNGWVIGYDSSDISKQTGKFATTPNGSQGGIWQSGGGIAVDSAGHLFVGSGNGTFDGNAGTNHDFSQTELKLTPSANGLFLANLATDYFTPFNANPLSGEDLDYGTSATVLLPDQSGPHTHLLVSVDKDGQIYLLDRDSLGGFSSTTNNDVQDFSDGGFNIHNSMAFFNNQLYLAPDGGPLSAWTFDAASQQFSTTAATAPDSSFGCDGCDGAGATPSISVNGTQAETAIVWVLDNSNFGAGPAVLHAFTPSLAKELYNSSQETSGRDTAANAVKFTTPTIANGYVYVGGSNAVTVYGLLKNLPPTAATPVASPLPGSYTAPVEVTLKSATPGASIYYTLNGTTPTTNSKLYSGPITLNATVALAAIAVAPGVANSNALNGVYAVGTPGTIFTVDTGFTASTMLLNGSAKLVNKRLRLTDGNETEAGSGYYFRPIRITNFSTSFEFQLTQAAADGFTFVMQNQGPTAVGMTGGLLGYGGITPSAAVKFDLYNNNGEGIDSTGFYTDGADPFVPAVDLTNTGIDLHSGRPMQVTISYDGINLRVTITDSLTHAVATQTYPVDLPAVLGSDTAWVGFSGGTGGLTAIQDILNWSWSRVPSQTFAATALKATTAGPALVPQSDGSFPKGAGVLFPATAVGQSVTFAVDVTNFATYAVQLLGDMGDNRGKVSLTVDGVGLGSSIDEYNPRTQKLLTNAGTLFLKPGLHSFKFTVTGKDAASKGYGFALGSITLQP